MKKQITDSAPTMLPLFDLPNPKLPEVISDPKLLQQEALRIALSMRNHFETCWQDTHRLEMEKQGIFPADSGMWGLLWAWLVKECGFKQTGNYRRSKVHCVSGHRSHEYYFPQEVKIG